MRKEPLQTALRRSAIVLLALSAAFLLRLTGYFSAPRLAAAAKNAGASPAAADTDAFRSLFPRAVAVRTAEGALYAAALDGETARQALLGFSALLGEAVGSAGEAAPLTEAAFRGALDREGLFVDLGCSVPLELLAEWLGVEAAAVRGFDASFLYLSAGGEDVALGFRSADGVYYRCGTAARADALSSRVAAFRAPSAAFAGEYSALRGLDPYMVIPAEMPEIQTLAAVPALSVADESLLSAAGMNSRLVTSYYDADGTQVLNEDGKTLRVGSGGMLSYRAPGGTEEEDAGLASAVDAAFRFAEKVSGSRIGDAALMFASAEASEGGGWTVCFDACAAGLPVLLPEGHAVSVTVSGTAVRAALFRLRRYTLTGEAEPVLPALQAAAAAAANSRAPALAYLDAPERVRCDWILN